jgi:D-sedoheptulose 7-phosphate isomerase
MKEKIKDHIQASLEAKEALLKGQVDIIEEIAEVISAALKKGNKLITFGNGGSAADAQHMAAELVGRYKKERGPLAAIALSTNTSNITAIANDYGYDDIFSRQLEALANEGDVALGISTSGQSANVVKALKRAKENGIKTIGFTSEAGGLVEEICDYCLKAPSENTPIIQEIHICSIHILCDLIESSLDA